MKYIITEQQLKTLENEIFNMFDKNLTPADGWEEDYQGEVNVNSGEAFFFVGERDEYDDWVEYENDNHMWYSECDNENLEAPIEEGECPVVLLPRNVYSSLNGYFGETWKKLFRRWFMQHTGLVVVKIDSL